MGWIIDRGREWRGGGGGGGGGDEGDVGIVPDPTVWGREQETMTLGRELVEAVERRGVVADDLYGLVFGDVVEVFGDLLS